MSPLAGLSLNPRRDARTTGWCGLARLRLGPSCTGLARSVRVGRGRSSRRSSVRGSVRSLICERRSLSRLRACLRECRLLRLRSLCAEQEEE